MLSRRTMLAGLGAFLSAPPAFAASLCGDRDGNGVRLCRAGLEVEPIETVRQRCDSWCWAACIQTVFALKGRDVAQETAVEKLFGSDRCEGATAAEIVSAIGGGWVDSSGFQFQASAEELSLAWMGIQTSGGQIDYSDQMSVAIEGTMNLFAADAIRTLVNELESGNALIIGALGHATVLTEASYREYPSGAIELIELVVRDPWPDSENRRVLQPDEVRAAFFVLKVSVG